MTDKDRKLRLTQCFEDGNLSYKEFTEGVKVSFEVGTNKAGNLISEFMRLGWVVKNGKDRSPDTVYKLMIS